MSLEAWTPYRNNRCVDIFYCLYVCIYNIHTGKREPPGVHIYGVYSMETTGPRGHLNGSGGLPNSPFGHSQGFRFHMPTPFDCFYLKDTPAYIVVCLYTPRQPKEFCYILPGSWKSDTKKSLNREEIRNISEFIEIYK